jgi:hypothetical protein
MYFSISDRVLFATRSVSVEEFDKIHFGNSPKNIVLQIRLVLYVSMLKDSAESQRKFLQYQNIFTL